VYVATPFESVPAPTVVVPSRKVTVPVAAAGDNVAVKVTLEPDTGEVAEAESEVVVDARLKATVAVRV
jgi:hypothetical protein